MIDYLDRLRDVGAPVELIERERDAWILMAARWPEALPDLMADKVAERRPESGSALPAPARFVDHWEDEELLQDTADLIHELLEDAAASGQLEWQGEDDARSSA